MMCALIVDHSSQRERAPEVLHIRRLGNRCTLYYEVLGYSLVSYFGHSRCSLYPTSGTLGVVCILHRYPGGLAVSPLGPGSQAPDAPGTRTGQSGQYVVLL